MSSSKSKNIIIYILLVFNIIILSILLVDKLQEKEARQAEAEVLRAVLLQSGIEIDEDISFRQYAPARCTVSRDVELEHKLIERIIGKCKTNDLGGNILFYESDVGQAVFRGTGEFDIVFSKYEPMGSGEAGDAARFMGRCGLELDAESGRSVDSSTGYDLVLCCTHMDYNVYNARLTFTMNNEGVGMINGLGLFLGEQTESSETAMDCITAVMRFLEIVRDEGYICSHITALEAGYVMSVSVSGECVLDPVWHIKTDTGDLYINAISGKIETIAT